MKNIIDIFNNYITNKINPDFDILYNNYNKTGGFNIIFNNKINKQYLLQFNIINKINIDKWKYNVFDNYKFNIYYIIPNLIENNIILINYINLPLFKKSNIYDKLKKTIIVSSGDSSYTEDKYKIVNRKELIDNEYFIQIYSFSSDNLYSKHKYLDIFFDNLFKFGYNIYFDYKKIKYLGINSIYNYYIYIQNRKIDYYNDKKNIILKSNKSNIVKKIKLFILDL